jgi:hypothetical protein
METSLAVDTLPEDYDDGPCGGHAQLLGSKSYQHDPPFLLVHFSNNSQMSMLVWGVAAFLGSALGPMIGE